MERSSTVETSFGTFTIKNELTIGEKSRIAIARMHLSEGTYGQMMASLANEDVFAAIDIFHVCEIDGRIETSPTDWKGCSELSTEQLLELWEGWTEKSGLFLGPAGGAGKTSGGTEEGDDQGGSPNGDGEPVSPGVV